MQRYKLNKLNSSRFSRKIINRYKGARKYKQSKSYTAKKKKPILLIFKKRYFWLAVLILVILGTLLYFIFLSPFFQVNKIEVYGSNKISIEKIKNIINEQKNEKIALIIPRNIFLIDFEKIEKIILEKFSRIAKLNLKRKLPDSLIVDIKERKPVLTWCKINKNEKEAEKEAEKEVKKDEDLKEIKIYSCFNLDKEGIVFEKTVNPLKPVIKSDKEIILAKRIIEKKYLEDILKIKQEIKNNLKTEIEEFNILEGQQKLVVKTIGGWEIYFNPLKNISDQLFNLNLVLKEKIPPEQRENLEYIDLRFGNRVFYKAKYSPGS